MGAELSEGIALLGVCAVVSIGSLDMVVVPVMGWLVLGVVKVIVKPSRCVVFESPRHAEREMRSYESIWRKL